VVATPQETVALPVEAAVQTAAATLQEETNTPVEIATNPVEVATISPLQSQKISTLSLASIKAKKELANAQKDIVKVEVQNPTEAFTESDMLQFWYKYAQRLNDKGHMIMESLLRIGDPKLEHTTIVYELPNEGSKIDFEREKPELLGYLRGHLHNHDIQIEVIVNEKIKSKVAFTPQDKFNRLNEINPNLEVLKKMFDLEF
jgi:hypothetical protein